MWTSIYFYGVEYVIVVGGGEVGDVEDPAAAVFFEPSVMFLAIPKGRLGIDT